MNPNIILCFIVLLFVALAHLIHIDYDESLEAKQSLDYSNTDFPTIEPLVRSDSDYSACKVGCIIACSNSCGVLQKECYPPCVHQCWNY
jgi:hypothetical protein